MYLGWFDFCWGGYLGYLENEIVESDEFVYKGK